MKINVLQVCNQLGLGGTEKTLQIFTENLDKNIFNVYVCGVMQGGERERLLKNKGFDVFIIGDNDQHRLIKLMKEKNIHLVHIHRAGMEEPFVILAAKKAAVPVIIETNVFGLVDKSKSGKLLDHHLFVSKMCALRYQKWTRTSNEDFYKYCKVLYNPIDLDSFENKKIQNLRTKLGFDQNETIIGRVGRADIGKWGDLCLNMIPHLLKNIPNVRYIIVGTPESKKQKMVKNVIYLENLSEDDLIEFYNSIDVLAHSSKIGESFGCTIAESMAAKKPVVVNSTPLADNAQIELVDNGITGFIANSPKEYAEAISFLLKNEHKRYEMGLAGYEKAKREYDAKKSTTILEKIYINILKEKGFKIDHEIIKKYETVDYFPSKDDIGTFEREYKKRLRNCFWKIDTSYKFEIFCYKYFLNSGIIISILKKINRRYW